MKTATTSNSSANRCAANPQSFGGRLLFCFAILAGPVTMDAATIWNGPTITYTQPAPDPTQAANRDQLTANVSLTRGVPSGGGSGGMFNGVTETAFTKFVSPAGTEWAVGALTNYASLSYTDWTSVAASRRRRGRW